MMLPFETETPQPSLRGIAEARLSVDLVAEIFSATKITVEPDEAREQLLRIFMRYAFSARAKPSLLKKEALRQTRKLEKAAERFLTALDELSEENASSVNWEILADMKSKAPGQSIELRSATPFMREFIEDALVSTSRILRAARSINDNESGDISKEKGLRLTPLDELILDLADTYQEWTGKAAISNCYYSDALEGYTGEFFEYAVALIDAYDSNCYFSRGALGQRILRNLRQSYPKDRAGQNTAATVL